MAPHEFGCAIHKCIRSSVDGLMCQVPLQVLSESRNRGVTLLWILLKGLCDDGVEFSTKAAAEPVGRGVSVACRRERSLRVRRDYVRWRLWIEIDDCPEQIRRRVRALSRWMKTRQKEIEQDSQCIYVGRGSHRIARDLLRRGVLGG